MKKKISWISEIDLLIDKMVRIVSFSWFHYILLIEKSQAIQLFSWMLRLVKMEKESFLSEVLHSPWISK